VKRRSAILATALLAGALIARAEESLPPGLTRSGNTIMMQPIAEGEGASGPANTEHRPGTIRILSAGDRDLYTRAFEAADRGDWTAAQNLAGQGHDAIATKLIAWRRLLDKNSGASFADIDSFIKSNSEWPLRDTLLARAENAIGPQLSPAGTVAWFGGRTPVTPMGQIVLGEALAASGRASDGTSLIRQGWREGTFDPQQELAIVQKDGAHLTPDDERERLDNLLWRDQIEDAKRELARVDGRTARISEVRIALRMDPGRAARLLDGLSGSAASDPGLLFDRARAARHVGSYQQAEALLLRIPSREPARTHTSRWWSEFNVEARQALEDHDARTAYQLASDTGLPTGDEYAEAQFLAGWIALRFLHEPRTARPHFERLDAAVSRPISKARAHYWIGRTYEADSDIADAWREYEIASHAPETFYGQIALSRIDPHPVLHVSETPVEPLPRSEFEKGELTRAMEVLADLGEENLLRTFALRDLELHPDAPHAKTLAEELIAWGFREIAVRVGKAKSYDGVMMLDYTHPVIPLPTYRGPSSAPEPALVLGLIRQETEFDPDAVSGPGARGIMQMMPEAARKAARESGLDYRPNDLLSDPAYNMQLGMTEISGDISQWGGSYVLAMASYNAGVHNAEKWLAGSGDPRSAATDPIDWIEQIPFTETRNYVQRVLENIQIYRNRLAGHDEPLRILADLYRPGSPSVRPLDYTPSRGVDPAPSLKPASTSPAQGAGPANAVTLPVHDPGAKPAGG
jgi:soluble lytic murein transglycosylase